MKGHKIKLVASQFEWSNQYDNELRQTTSRTRQHLRIPVTSYIAMSSKDILLSLSLSLSLPAFSCSLCLEYLLPRALILPRLWRYITHVLTWLHISQRITYPRLMSWACLMKESQVLLSSGSLASIESTCFSITWNCSQHSMQQNFRAVQSNKQ